MTFTWVAFLLRTLNLAGQSLWRDEVDAIRFSSWSLSELVTGLFRVGHNGPLFFLLLRFWRNFAGQSEFGLRYPSALLGALAIPLGFVLARQLGLSRRVGLLLALLLATSPYLVWYGQEAKMYTLLLVLVFIAFMAYLKALTSSTLPSREGQGEGAWWLIFVIATTLSFYTHILAPLMLPVYGLVALLQPAELCRHWRGWLISITCLTVPYLPLALWQAPLLWTGFQSGHPFYPLARQFGILLHLYSTGLLHFIVPIASILFMFLFLSGLFLPSRTTANQTTADRRPPTAENNPITPHFSLFTFHFSLFPPPTSRLILALWTLLPPLIVYLISLRIQVFEDRYLIYIVPGFYLIVILGLLAVRRYSRRLAGLCLGLILVINLMAVWQQQRQPIKANFRAAAAYLSSQPQPPSPINVQFPYLQNTLAY